MQAALTGQPVRSRQQPDGVVTVKIDPATGDPASPNQSDAIFEYFLAENAPKPNLERRPTAIIDPDDRPAPNGAAAYITGTTPGATTGAIAISTNGAAGNRGSEAIIVFSPAYIDLTANSTRIEAVNL